MNKNFITHSNLMDRVYSAQMSVDNITSKLVKLWNLRKCMKMKNEEVDCGNAIRKFGTSNWVNYAERMACLEDIYNCP